MTAAGYSLGANILTRYLGEEGSSAPLAAAVSLCNPFNLARPRLAPPLSLRTQLASTCKGVHGRHSSARTTVLALPQLALRDWPRRSSGTIFLWAHSAEQFGIIQHSLFRAQLFIQAGSIRTQVIGPTQEVANANLASGVRHVYNLALGAKLRESTKQHAALFRGHPPPAGWDVDAALRGRTIGDYDRAITIHVFGAHFQQPPFMTEAERVKAIENGAADCNSPDANKVTCQAHQGATSGTPRHSRVIIAMCSPSWLTMLVRGGLGNTRTRALVATGFESLEAYYANSSSDEAVPKVRVPLLCIQVRGARHRRQSTSLIPPALSLFDQHLSSQERAFVVPTTSSRR